MDERLSSGPADLQVWVAGRKHADDGSHHVRREASYAPVELRNENQTHTDEQEAAGAPHNVRRTLSRLSEFTIAHSQKEQDVRKTTIDDASTLLESRGTSSGQPCVAGGRNGACCSSPNIMTGQVLTWDSN